MGTEAELANGLIVGHAYSVTDAKTVCIKLCCSKLRPVSTNSIFQTSVRERLSPSYIVQLAVLCKNQPPSSTQPGHPFVGRWAQ